jgi:hypothetical protein
MECQPYRSILKRVGIVVIMIGLADIGVMVYCIVNKISYSSSLNVCAVVAGVLLVRGNLRAASTVRWFGVFLLSACIAVLFASPAIQPIDLTVTEMRLHPSAFVAGLASTAFMVALMFWVIKELGRESVKAASDSVGLKRRDMRVPVALGIALVIGLGVTSNIFLTGESGERAKSMAEKQVGPGYKFHVRSMRISNAGQTQSADGVVTAWNEKEIREIPVKW